MHKNQEKTLRRSTQIVDLVYMMAFKHHFFQFNLSVEFGYESPRGGPLLWPVIHNMQSSQTPSSTSRSLTAIESESFSSQYQNILGLLLKIEVRDKKQRKRRDNHNLSCFD